MFEPVWSDRTVLFYFPFGQLSEIGSIHCARQIQSQEYLKKKFKLFFCLMSGAVLCKYTVCSKRILRMDSRLFDYPDRLLHSNR